MMRMSAYEALSFWASRRAAAPRFSSSGLGVVEPSGAANRRVASAAAVPDWRKVRRVSMRFTVPVYRTTLNNFSPGALPRVSAPTYGPSTRVALAAHDWKLQSPRRRAHPPTDHRLSKPRWPRE